MTARYAIASRKRGISVTTRVLRPTVRLRHQNRPAARGENSAAARTATLQVLERGPQLVGHAVMAELDRLVDSGQVRVGGGVAIPGAASDSARRPHALPSSSCRSR